MVLYQHDGKGLLNKGKRVIMRTMENRVKMYRIMKNMRQIDLAAAAGCSQQEISGIEKGEIMPTIYVALCIARALDRKVEELFMLKEE